MSSYNTHFKFPRDQFFQMPEADALPLEKGEQGKHPPVYLPLKIPEQGTFIFKHAQRFIYGANDCVYTIHPLHVAFCTVSDDVSDSSTGEKQYSEVVVLDIESESDITTLKVNGIPVASVGRGVIHSEYAFYWLSLDMVSDEKCIRFGHGEARMGTELLTFPIGEKEEYKFKNLTTLSTGYCVQHINLLRDPIVGKVPLVVKGTEEVTMEEVASNDVMPASMLSAVGRKLYDTIAGRNFVLDAPDFPDFSKAIKHSIETPGCWCHEKLKSKAGEFGGPDEVYLRITLGKNGGESPGIPFVMEIWPPQCYSPIHQHAGANAIIRVLHGEIEVALFPFLGIEALQHTPSSKGAEVNQSEEAVLREHGIYGKQNGEVGAAHLVPVAPFATASFSKDEITWISPLLNQTHRLKNNAPRDAEPCITIQCYMYDEADRGHYPFFDYVDDEGNEHGFAPNSDMDFLKFKETMKREWEVSINLLPTFS